MPNFLLAFARNSIFTWVVPLWATLYWATYCAYSCNFVKARSGSHGFISKFVSEVSLDTLCNFSITNSNEAPFSVFRRCMICRQLASYLVLPQHLLCGKVDDDMSDLDRISFTTWGICITVSTGDSDCDVINHTAMVLFSKYSFCFPKNPQFICLV